MAGAEAAEVETACCAQQVEEAVVGLATCEAVEAAGGPGGVGSVGLDEDSRSLVMARARCWVVVVDGEEDKRGSAADVAAVSAAGARTEKLEDVCERALDAVCSAAEVWGHTHARPLCCRHDHGESSDRRLCLGRCCHDEGQADAMERVVDCARKGEKAEGSEEVPSASWTW